MAPVLVASLGGRSLMAPPPLLHPTVEYHVHGLVGENMLEVPEPRRFRARDDEEQQRHQSPPPNHGLRSTPSRPRGVARLQRRSTPALTPDPGERRLGSSVLFVLFRKLMVPKIRGITEVGRGNILTRPSGQTRDRGRNDRGPGIYLLRFEASARFPRRPQPLETFWCERRYW